MPRVARKPPTTLRKRPRQARSAETVTTILEAGARVLVAHGFEGLTTNRVAETAGVSIGSLYQYFPNKDALVATLVETLLGRMHRELMTGFAGIAELPLEQAVRRMVQIMIRINGLEPKLYRVILEQVPRAGRMDRVLAFQALAHRMVTELLRTHPEARVVDPDLAAFVVMSAVESSTYAAVMYRSERLRDVRLTDEITALVVLYLRHGGARGLAG